MFRRVAQRRVANVRNYQRDRGYLQESVDMFRSIGDLNNLARFLGHLGRMEILHGDFESAQKTLGEASSLIRGMNRKAISFSVWRADEQLAVLHGDYERAHTSINEALEYADKTDESGSPDHQTFWAIYRRFGLTIVYNTVSASDKGASINAIYLHD